LNLRILLVRLLPLALALTAAVGWSGMQTAFADANVPSGERINGQSTLEPAYDDMTGNQIYLNTPNNAHLNANPRAWAPLYVVEYPKDATVGTLQCAHIPADNCPDHGPLIAGVAASIMPSVYGAGALGHDHLLAAPGSGGDFNIAWEPYLVLFTNAAAANTHITTLAQLQWALNSGNAISVPLPQATFHCSVVSGAVYDHATPVTPV
jgi:hypothetical protein